MVTAPAAASISHAPQSSSAGVAPPSSQPPNSFQNVYQNLPSDSQTAGNSQLPSPKGSGCKKSSSKTPRDAQPAVTAVSLPIDPPPQHAWPPVLSPISFAPQDPSALLGANAQAVLDDSSKASVSTEAAGAAASNPSALPGDAFANQARRSALARLFNPRDLIKGSKPALLAAQPVDEPRSLPDIAAQAAEAHSAASARGSLVPPSVQPAIINKGIAASIVPRSENLAFSLRMREADSLANHAPAASNRNQSVNQIKNEARALEDSVADDDTRPQSPSNMSAEVPAATASLLWSEAAAAPRPDTQMTEPRGSLNSTAVAAMHEVQPVLPNFPKAPATAEILLELGGKDQAAAIRITDRAGNINVSVHAADPDLRSSLRSNLGELASQLAHQGWKADELKTGTLTRGETSQDSRQDGQRSPGQQQSFTNGDRHAQRDRRAHSGHWIEEFEEQSSGNSGKPGGTN